MRGPKVKGEGGALRMGEQSAEWRSKHNKGVPETRGN